MSNLTKSQKRSISIEKEKANLLAQGKELICRKCNEEKEILKGKWWCRDCKNSYEHERRSNLPDEKKQDMRDKENKRYESNKQQVQEIIVDTTEMKECSICNITQTLDNFHLAKTKGKIRSMCKSCSSEKRQEYYQNNRDAVIKQTNQYKVEKMKTDPVFKLERRMRCRIYQALTNQEQNKTERTWEYLDCTSTFFKRWMEFQLYDGMTLENYGEIWHVDHVKPCARFDLSKEEEINECFSWKNLKPLRAEKNLKKKDAIESFEILLQELKAKYFLQHLSEDVM